MTDTLRRRVKNRSMLQHLWDRNEREKMCYSVMEFTIVVAKNGNHGADVSCMRFCLKYGVTAAFHSHRITNENWTSRIADITHFIGDIEATGVFVDAEDEENVLGMLCDMYKGLTETKVKDCVFHVIELELSILGILAPHFMQFWNREDYEDNIARSFQDVLDTWSEGRPSHCCFNECMLTNVKRVWHLLKMVQMVSNVLEHPLFAPAPTTFSIYFTEISVRPLLSLNDGQQVQAVEPPEEPEEEDSTGPTAPVDEKQEVEEHSIEVAVEPEQAPKPQTGPIGYRMHLDENGEISWEEFFRLYPKKH
ncbi:hypothetical protein L596_028779 [Steinernema carpocapsae]|uniref:Uncharacterized protein n=1 Tax=Steinernema carpocapsae TaxID=34508 RepID=A0A4U5LZD3_STECR|nr:hypothetical protein L596_028779 [Steinernema carpocapsae]